MDRFPANLFGKKVWLAPLNLLVPGLMCPADQWLVTLSDPEKQTERPPSRLDRPTLFSVCLLADLHGVLPAVWMQLEPLLKDNPRDLLVDPEGAPAIFLELEPVRKRLAERSALALFLAAETRRLRIELKKSGAEILILKGSDFAARLYTPPALRWFVDVDLLIRPADWEIVAAALDRLGYRERATPMKHADGYAERSWEHPAMPGAMIEVHDNLVNSPTIRRGVSVRLDDVPVETGPDGWLRPTAAGLLLIAAVHGAASHSFDKLQHLCDLRQIARQRAGSVNAGALAESARKTGAGFCVAMGLDLAARTFRDPACAAAPGQFNFRWPRTLARRLVTPQVVLRSQGPQRRAASWRRQLLRQMLKSRR